MDDLAREKEALMKEVGLKSTKDFENAEYATTEE